MRVSMTTPLPSADSLIESTAPSMIGRTAVGRGVTSNLPSTIREASSRFSMRYDCAQPARSIAAIAPCGLRVGQPPAGQ